MVHLELASFAIEDTTQTQPHVYPTKLACKESDKKWH
jgi:hypothetical protein